MHLTSAGAGPGDLAVGALGGFLLAVTMIDVFVTIFAYDGYTFLAARVHRVTWAVLRTSTRWLPDQLRHNALSLGSALLLPATLIFWLALETAGFGMIYVPGLAHGSFVVSDHAGRGFVSAFYLSGGDLTSLTFGDLVPHTTFYRAMVDLETGIGIATMTLALTYVLSAFDALTKLSGLYSRVRRNAVEPHRPATILERRYRSNDVSYYSDFLSAVVEELEAYNESLRRFPVAFYFHTRRLERATPTVLSALGRLIELSRWGLPRSDSVSTDPNLLALVEEYTVTLTRLRRTFLHPRHVRGEPIPSEAQFRAEEDDPETEAGEFTRLRAEARNASQVGDQATLDERYARFAEWLRFHRLVTSTVDALSRALGYGVERSRLATWSEETTDDAH